MRQLFVIFLFFGSFHAAWAQEQNDTLLREAANRNVAVATVLDAPLETPEQRLQAVFTMLELDEQEVAAVLLEPILAAEYDDQTRAAFVAKFGTARFLRLARQDQPVSEEDPGPLPGARKFAQACLKAAHQQARNPQRVANLVEQLNAATPEERKAARVDLAVTGTAGGKACLEALAQESEPDRRANIMRAVIGLRPAVDPQLLAVLANGEGLLLRDVAEIAGHTGMLDSAPLLAAIAVRSDIPAETQAAAQNALAALGLSSADLAGARGLLLGEVRRLETAPDVAPVDTEQSNQWWKFDAKASQLNSIELPGRHNTLARIHVLAQALASLPGASDGDRQLALLYALQFSKQLQQPLPPEAAQLARELGIAELSLTLADALKHNQAAAVIACAELLGQRGDVAALHSYDGRPAPLAKGLQHGNRDVRFAALEAIMAIAPQETFAGASYVPKALWEFVAAAGAPQAVAASSVVAKASDWAGQLRGLGYDAYPAVGGREALRSALASPRLTLLIVDSDIGEPRLREVLYQFRNGRTTAQVPVAIFSSSPNLEKSLLLADQDPLLLAIARPHREGDFAAIVEQLIQLNPARTDAETRLRQSTKALGWVAQLKEQGHPYTEFHRGSEVVATLIYNPQLTAGSIKAMASLATATSQQALVDFASNPTVSVEKRRQAVEAFRNNVKQHGIMLISQSIDQQYDRYNASESAGPDTQKILSELLDILERKPPARASP